MGQIMIFGDKCINYYTFKGDTLLQVGKESPLEIISYSIPLHNMKYPIVYGDSLYIEFECEGVYCGDHLSMTRIGIGQLQNLINSSTKIHIDMTNEIKNSMTYGETIQGNFDKNSNYGRYFVNGQYRLNDANIKIYFGSIKESIRSDSGLKYEGLPEDEALGIVMSHETVHCTNITEIDADIKYEVKHGGKPRPDREALPREIEKQVRHELEEK